MALQKLLTLANGISGNYISIHRIEHYDKDTGFLRFKLNVHQNASKKSSKKGPVFRIEHILKDFTLTKTHNSTDLYAAIYNEIKGDLSDIGGYDLSGATDV